MTEEVATAILPIKVDGTKVVVEIKVTIPDQHRVTCPNCSTRISTKFTKILCGVCGTIYNVPGQPKEGE